MTALRPEHDAGYGAPYEQGAYAAPDAFEAAVDGLADPLNDPLPGQRPGPQEAAPSWPATGDAYGASEQPPGAAGPAGHPGGAAVPPAEWPQEQGYRAYDSADGYGQSPGQERPPGPQSGPDWQGAPAYLPQEHPQEHPRGDQGLIAGVVRPARGTAAPVPGHLPVPEEVPATAPLPLPGTAADDAGHLGTEPGSMPTPLAAAAGLSAAAEAVAASVTGPSTGGRAERRKAAAGKAGHGRSHKRQESGGAASPGTGPGQSADPESASARSDSRPLSRVEARRAAQALKESPGVIVSRVVGELFITFGALMLLFVTYQLWWTNVRADQYAGKETNKIQQGWAKGRQPGAFEPGQGFAIMHIPKLDVVAPIAQGISKKKVLDHGEVGHYSDGALKTAMPSDKLGNFAVAGHRNTHGEPFRYINHLKPGDKIVVETQDAYYTYAMTKILPQTSPSNVSVISPVPPGSGFTEPGRYITLTTCTPEFTSTYRMIVWGKMVEERPRSKGKPDALVGG